MEFLLDADDDWQEPVRRYWYPRIHSVLTKFGGYGVGHIGEDQYVGSVDTDEEAIEEELVAVGAERNPVAAFKSLRDGRESEGSWRFTHRSRPDVCDPGMQLHVTLFVRAGGEPGRAIYAHYEDDWSAAPIDHLRGTRFSPSIGVEKTVAVIDNETYLVRK